MLFIRCDKCMKTAAADEDNFIRLHIKATDKTGNKSILDRHMHLCPECMRNFINNLS